MLNDNAVLADAGHGDALVGDAFDGSGGAVNCLDANTVLRVCNGGGFDRYCLDGVVGSAANGTNAETVATGAASTCECNAL